MRSSTRQFFLNFHRDDINLYLFRLSIDLELARKISSFFSQLVGVSIGSDISGIPTRNTASIVGKKKGDNLLNYPDQRPFRRV